MVRSSAAHRSRTCVAFTRCSRERAGWTSSAIRTSRKNGRGLRPTRPTRTRRVGWVIPRSSSYLSTRDDRVHPGLARKMAARVEEPGYDVSYYEEIEGGHGARVTNEELAHRLALSYTHLWSRLSAR